MDKVNISNLRTRDDRGSIMVNYDFVVRDQFATVKRNGSGSFCVSNIDAVESQIRNDMNRKLGYRSFDVLMPTPSPVADAAATPKRAVLGVRP